MILNNQQSKVLADMTNFVNAGSDQIYVLRGHAGTGKTVLIKELVKGIKGSIAMTAPTNKAVQVLRKDPIPGVEYQTIHKLLGMKRVIDDQGEEYFIGGTSRISHDVLILDEVSMLDDSIFKLLEPLRSTISIILVGDDKQIPPVRQSDCIPFRGPNGMFLYGDLTEIMRQKECSAILDLGKSIRDNIHSKDPIDRSRVCYYNTSVEGVREELHKHLEYEFKNGDPKVLAWTNRAVDGINALIRGMLYGNAGQLVENERLVMNAPFKGLYTGDELIVKSMVPSVMSCENYPVDLGYYKTRVMKGDKQYEIDILDDTQRELFNKCLSKLRTAAMKTADKPKRRKAWARWYAFREEFADVSYGYAMTVHKSQGSEYDKVFVIEHDIDENRNVYERNRLKYTAVTRAKKELILVGRR